MQQPYDHLSTSAEGDSETDRAPSDPTTETGRRVAAAFHHPVEAGVIPQPSG
jgi:hypothetical protein